MDRQLHLFVHTMIKTPTRQTGIATGPYIYHRFCHPMSACAEELYLELEGSGGAFLLKQGLEPLLGRCDGRSCRAHVGGDEAVLRLRLAGSSSLVSWSQVGLLRRSSQYTAKGASRLSGPPM